MKTVWAVAVTFFFVFVNAPNLRAQWGDLTATFLFDGKRPDPKPLNAQICGAIPPLFDESLVINPKNGGVANIVVQIFVKNGAAKPAIHPDYEKLAEDKITLDNRNCRFEPHILVLRTGQTLELKNSDPFAHNSKIDFLTNASINPILPANSVVKLRPAQTQLVERFPAGVSCAIHPWMQAKLLVKDHPYVAVSDADGKILLKNLPVGKLTFQIWHESNGYITSATIAGDAKTFPKGQIEKEIQGGGNELGIIKISAATLKL